VQFNKGQLFEKSVINCSFGPNMNQNPLLFLTYLDKKTHSVLTWSARSDLKRSLPGPSVKIFFKTGDTTHLWYLRRGTMPKKWEIKNHTCIPGSQLYAVRRFRKGTSHQLGIASTIMGRLNNSTLHVFEFVKFEFELNLNCLSKLTLKGAHAWDWSK